MTGSSSSGQEQSCDQLKGYGNLVHYFSPGCMWKQCKLWHNSGPCYSLEVPSSDGGIWQSACSMECFLLTATVISYSLKAPANYPSSNPSFKLLFAGTPVRTVAHSTASVVICPYLILSFLIPFASLTEIKDTRSRYDS